MARENNFVFLEWFTPAWLASLCAIALQEDIEVDHVHRIIATYRLEPPTDEPVPENWPFPVRLYSQGRQEVWCNGVPLEQARGSRKPMALLWELVAEGGRGVSVEMLCDNIWPDAEGDTAYKALTTNVHRLRKLIGADAIRLEGGRLSLNGAVCWLDLWAWEQHLKQAQSCLEDNDLKRAEAAMSRALALYRGPLLNGAGDGASVLARREECSRRMIRQLCALTDKLISEGEASEAEDLLNKALSAEPYAEPLYQELIRAQLAQGHTAQARKTYDTCRLMLQAHFKVEPTLETQSLVQGI